MRRGLVIVVVGSLAALLFLWRGCGGSGEVLTLDQDVAHCMANLRELYAGFVRYAQAHGDQPLPARAGVALLGVLVAEGALPDTPESRARLTCPGPLAQAVAAEVDYRAPDALTGASSAYALRDLVTFPLARFPAGGATNEPLAACDNAHGMNHDGCMNVLYSDGSVKTFTLEQEIERGTLPPGAKTIPVGPGSPLPELRTLLPD